MTHFIGVDGEGVTHPTGRHDYVLLSVGDQSLHHNGDRLAFNAIMPFLYRQHQLNPRSAFVGYYLSYDFSQWLQEIPEQSAWMLLNDKGIALRKRKIGPNPDPFPVRFNGWEFDLLGMRRMKIRPAMQNPIETTNVYSWMWICDAGPFWQTSFMNAIDPRNWNEPITTGDEWEIICRGKASRSNAQFDADMVLYNVTENTVLARTMQYLDTGYRSQGWRLNRKQWFGPGQAADLWLRSISVPTREEIESVTPMEVLNASRCAYYGGWFEIPRHGLITGASFEYDINSAYPHVISGLPCLLHGRWTHSANGIESLDTTGSAYNLCHVTAYGSDRYFGGLPHRDDHGIITRPHITTGWYWEHEIEAAVRAGTIDNYTVRESYMYTQTCNHRPFASIVELYQQRLSIGKNTATGKALRLVYNSAYGKFAQSVGNPRFANAIIASLITAGCRTMILDAIATHPNGTADVLMIATDGIYFRSPHPSLPLSKTELGLWDAQTKENMTLFMPGIYWDDKTRGSLDSDSVQIKSRGINARDLADHIDNVDEQFRNFGRGAEWLGPEWPSITVPVRFSVIGPKLALSRGKWDTCGNIVTDGSKTLSSNPSNKRNPLPMIVDGLLTTRPYSDKGVSVGYSKSFGMDIEALIDNDEFVSDDGTINLELIELLRGS